MKSPEDSSTSTNSKEFENYAREVEELFMGRGHDHTKFCSVGQISFADDITDAIEGFATEQDLAFDSYYHDLPVWMVFEHRSIGTTRRLQLTAYLVSDSLYLSLLSSIHIALDDGTALVPKKVEPERFPLGQVLTEEGTFNRALLREKLRAAWDRAGGLEFAPDEMMRVQLPKNVDVEGAVTPKFVT